MKGDVVNSRWAGVARAAVEAAAKDMSEVFPHAQGGKCRIAWGHAHYEDAESQEGTPLQNQLQCGLLIWHGEEIELTIPPDGDPPNFMDLRIKFTSPSEQELSVPLTPRLLYNVLAYLDRNIKLRLVPRPGPARISVLGAETSVPVESLTGRILHDAITRLHMSRLAVDAIRDTGDDWWSMELGE